MLGTIRNPTLVVVGALDMTPPPALARGLEVGIAGARLVEIPECAYGPPIEQPENFVRGGRRLPWAQVLPSDIER